MPAFFVDSSALVKRYVEEAGTAWVRRMTRRHFQTPIYLARITTVEVTSAVARRRKGKMISPSKASSVLHRFRQHLTGRYTVIDLTPAMFNSAAQLANTHSLRAYDAVQLATALHIDRRRRETDLPPVTLVSADGELNAAAVAEGLSVENPNEHMEVHDARP